ncbi:MAG: tetratricopeptide repeat protein [Deltaproteobacteria bacterium]|nr:tetratricopeptide repeat protein [Deltaproteobacteria bacterium]
MTAPVRLLLVLFVTLFAARVAYADDPSTRSAKRHFDRGQKLFNLGKFDEALEEYQQAYEAQEIPAFLFNIGQCYRNLGDYDAAIFSFKKYLKLEPDAENREQVEEYITELEAEQEKGNSRRFKLDKKRDEPVGTAAPIYKKWWFWTGIAVVGVAGGVGIYAATRADPAGPPTTTLGHPPIVFAP